MPLGILSYGLVHLWFLQHGDAEHVVQKARLEAPWYRHKKFPSFADMLESLQEVLHQARLSADPPVMRVEEKPDDGAAELLRTG